MNEIEYVGKLVERARIAQKTADSYSQEMVDTLAAAIAWTAVKTENAQAVAKLAAEETMMGNYESKLMKITKKVRGCLRDVKNDRTVGIIEEDENKGLIKIAKPVGVIGALIPCTNPEATPVIKAIFSIKGRNAIIFAPHPRSRKTTNLMVNLMRETLKKYNVPQDLLICIDNPTIEISNELMKQCDLIVATGGTPMVKAAYSSGTPAYGVGTGNAVVVVDETADINDSAHKIMLSKTFDYATSCSSENSLVIQESIYERLVCALTKEGGYLLSEQEKQILCKAMWTDGHLNKNIIAQPASSIAAFSGICVPKDTKFLMVNETGIGKDYPFAGEKLSVVVTLYRYREFDEAVQMVNAITEFQGKGHSCGIHSFDKDNILTLSLKTKTSRVMVRQPQCYGNSGDWCNGMPFSLTLGCGTWGGNITSENVCMKHFINTTWVSYPIGFVIPDDEELFGNVRDNI